MVAGKVIQIRVTRNQHDRILNNAYAKGYKTISDFLRSVALDQNLDTNKKIDAIYNAFLSRKNSIEENDDEKPGAYF